MTPEDRYRELRDQSERFSNLNLVHHHFIRHLREAVAEAYEDAAKLAETKFANQPDWAGAGFWMAEIIRDRAKENPQ